MKDTEMLKSGTAQTYYWLLQEWGSNHAANVKAFCKIISHYMQINMLRILYKIQLTELSLKLAELRKYR